MRSDRTSRDRTPGQKSCPALEFTLIQRMIAERMFG